MTLDLTLIGGGAQYAYYTQVGPATPSNISKLTSDAIQHLTSADIGSITSDQIQYIQPTQIGYLTISFRLAISPQPKYPI